MKGEHWRKFAGEVRWTESGCSGFLCYSLLSAGCREWSPQCSSHRCKIVCYFAFIGEIQYLREPTCLFFHCAIQELLSWVLFLNPALVT